jgi:hypothetical protein
MFRADSGHGDLAMQSITELAAALKVASDVVENSTDDETGLKNMEAIYAVENHILAKQFTQADAIEANAKILYQFGKPDYADRFYRKLRRKILKALLPGELGKIAAAA